jgi:hypothetical protein
LSVEVVCKPPKPVPEKVVRNWTQEWAKEGEKIDWQKLMPPQGFRVLPRRWVVERTFSWLGHNRRMSKDYERLCATGEAFGYVAMTRLMVRRLTRALKGSSQNSPSETVWKIGLGSESGLRGPLREAGGAPDSAASWRPRPTVEKPSAIFQTVSPCTRVNRARERPRRYSPACSLTSLIASQRNS